MSLVKSLKNFILGNTTGYVLKKGQHFGEDTIDQPFKSLVFTREQLKEYAKQLAHTHETENFDNRYYNLMLSGLKKNNVVLNRVHKKFSKALADEKNLLPSSTEWLLDNYYIVRDQISSVNYDLTLGFYKDLAKLKGGPLHGFPRIYSIALELLTHSDNRLDKDLIDEFITSYESVSPLTSAELWAFPIMLRLVLIENLKRLMERSEATFEKRKLAKIWAERLVSLRGLFADQVFRELGKTFRNNKNPDPLFLIWILRSLRDKDSTITPIIRWLEEYVKEEDINLEEIVKVENQRQASYRVLTGNIITSMRLISGLDWSIFFESTSMVEKILKTDPTQTYEQMDFASRDVYRHTVEYLSKFGKYNEQEVARRAVKLAGSETGKKSHVGYYLIDKGLGELKISTGYTPSFLTSVKEYISRYPTFFYLIGVTSSTGVLMFLTSIYLMTIGLSPLWVLTLIIPISVPSIEILNGLITRFFPPITTVKLELKDGIPDEFRTIVVVPWIVGDVNDTNDISDLILKLEKKYMANSDNNLLFALLSDFPDAPSENMDYDSQLINEMKAQINRLNNKHTTNGVSPFYLFHRDRTFNQKENVWMGRERKRGKLEEFNSLICDGLTGSYKTVIGDLNLIKTVKYVITLDEDTLIPLNTAKKLIGAIAHPLNRPVLDEFQNKVIEGYGIIQPRVDIFAPSAAKSFFTKLFAPESGLDPYHSVVSEVYQDFFHSASYIGKAIYDVSVFNKCLTKKFPNNLLLSHDLLEGNYLRVALATDIELLEDFPTGYDSFSRRQHRWIRGDWQIISWLFPWVKNANGKVVKNNLGLIDKWKIFDNLRRGLVIPAGTIMAICGWLLFPHVATLWTLLVLGMVFFPVLKIFLFNLKSLNNGGLINFISTLWEIFSVNTTRLFIMISFMFYETYRNINAIYLAAMRVFFKQKGALEWTSHMVSEVDLNSDFFGYIKKMYQPIIFGVPLLIWFSFTSVETFYLPVLVITLWISSPLVASLISRRVIKNIQTLTKKERNDLLLTARKIWNFFDEFANSENNYLPPDNLQVSPGPKVAKRTSPTDIGFLLLSCISAYDFGFIKKDNLEIRLTRIFTTLEKLKKYNGHFLNWYQTDTLEELHPSYVSTVDSGNLACCLIAIKQTCLEISEKTNKKENFLALAKRADDMVRAMDFKFLFDLNLKVFSIGYNVDENILDASYYNLLASEARLASYISISLGQIPEKHWFDLGRPLKKIKGKGVLLSWGGTIFEYLMPELLLTSYENTLLSQTNNEVVDRQIDYARKKSIPWGISESGFYAFDYNYNYQYQQFGVPDLSLKITMSENLVVSPYASLLALSFRPSDVYKNLKHLESIGAGGEYGYFESVDFNPERIKEKSKFEIVQSYLSHHQGMSMVAINNYLNNQIVKSRFQRDELIASVELLLSEKIPQHISKIERSEQEVLIPTREFVSRELSTPIFSGKTETIRSSVLSNSEYSVVVTNGGTGYSSFRNIDLTRWQIDTVDNNWGWFCFIKDYSSNDVWSATYQPYLKKPDHYSVSFLPHKAEFSRRDNKIETKTTVFVTTDNNVEVREVTLTNKNTKTKKIEVTDYAEVVGLKHHDDAFHPAFGKLFIESEYDLVRHALLFKRRVRTENTPELWIWHTLRYDKEKTQISQYETNRENFIGRGHTILNSVAFDNPLSNSSGATLDPIMSLRTHITLKPGETKRLFFITGASDSKENAFELIDKFSESGEVERAFKLAEIHSQIELKHLGIKTDEANEFQKLGSRIIYPDRYSRASQSILSQNIKGQSGLYPFGISGDFPIVLVKIKSRDGLPLIRQSLLAHEFLRMKNIKFDLIILNEQNLTYSGDLREAIHGLIDTSLSRPLVDKAGGIFVRDASHMTKNDSVLFETMARIVLDSQLGNLEDAFDLTPRSEIKQKNYELDRKKGKEVSSMKSDTPIGSFSPSGDEFLINSEKGELPPMPWSNIIATKDFGTLVTSSGLGYTWAKNSQVNRLTTWSNDAVTERPGEVIYFKEKGKQGFWSATSLPSNTLYKYSAKHGWGYSSFLCKNKEVTITTDVWVDPNDPVKIISINFKNNTKATKKIKPLYYAELVLGDTREQNQFFIVSEFDKENGAIITKNSYNDIYSNNITFALSSEVNIKFTADRMEFLGRGGSWARPSYLEEDFESELSGRVGAGLDPAIILETEVDVLPGQNKQMVFVLGQAQSRDQYISLANKYKDVLQARDSLTRAKEVWRKKINVIQIKTPDKNMDTLANGWLIYQTLSGRFWGRTSFYQSGGAFGFRDQLQDLLALMYSNPEIVREHILYAAKHQFIQGDVMHWWHPDTTRGVRTKISDDFLWLPYIVGKYISKTKDTGILDELVSFMDMAALEEQEIEKYDEASITQEKHSIYLHCIRALENGMKTGKHGLPLIGSGDWNDGLNSVGEKGIGESVWLAWFQYDVYLEFSQIAKRRGDKHNYFRYQRYARLIKTAAEKHGWDGDWYKRAYFDNGDVLGSKDNSEDMIDSVSQTWSVISGGATDNRGLQALEAVEQHLVKEKEGLILLLTPPFETSSPFPGYIRGYIPGIRENGSQYTHAAVWLPLAYTKVGQGDRAVALLDLINPINHTDTAEKVNIYKDEPYVLAGDVYSHPQHVGRAGWSWYTGSAAWMYKIIIEDVLGLTQSGNYLSFNPCIPKSWSTFEIKYSWRETFYNITFTNGDHVGSGVTALSLDKNLQKKNILKMINDKKTHDIQVVLGKVTKTTI